MNDFPTIQNGLSPYAQKPWWKAGDTALLVLLIAVLLVPLWSSTYVPTQDGPLHLANSIAVMNYDSPGWDTTQLYYELNDPRFPTWLPHLSLGLLTRVLPGHIAVKVFLSLYVVGLPLSFCFMLRPLTRTPQLGGLLVLPVVYNYTFHMGFFAFIQGMVLLLFLLGVWLRCQEKLIPRWIIAASLVSFFAFQFHPFSWGLAAMALGCLEGAEYLSVLASRSPWTAKLGDSMRIFTKRWLLYVATILPAGIHMFIFLMLQESTPGGLASRVASEVDASGGRWGLVGERLGVLVDRVLEFLTLSSLVSFSRVELVFSIGLLLSLVLLSFLCIRAERPRTQGQRRGHLLLITLCFSGFYLLSSEAMAGGAYVPPRIQLVVLLGLIAWVASTARLYRFRILVGCLSTAMVIPAAGFYTHTYARFDREIARELALAEYIEEGSTVMPIIVPSDTEGREVFDRPPPNHLLHAEGHFVPLRRVVDLGNYQGWNSYFPLRFRSDFDPLLQIAVDEKIAFSEDSPPDLDLSRNGDGQLRVDYVIIVGAIDHFGEEPEIHSLLSQLEKHPLS